MSDEYRTEPNTGTGLSTGPSLDASFLDPSFLEDVRWLEQLAGRLSRDPGLAQDACQNVWLSWSRDRRGAGERADRVGLARALRRALWLSRRSDGRRRERERRVAGRGASASTDELIARGEERERAWRALVELEEPLRTTLLLRFEEGLTPNEIAERTDVAADTVRHRLRRGIALLRVRLGHDVDESDAPSRGLFAFAPLAGLLRLLRAPTDRRRQADHPPGPAPTAPSTLPVATLVMSKALVAVPIVALCALAVVLVVRDTEALDRRTAPAAAVPAAADVAAAGRAAVSSNASVPLAGATARGDERRRASSGDGSDAAGRMAIVVARAVELNGRDQRPLEGAWIEASAGDDLLGRAVSDAEGRLRLELAAPLPDEVRLELGATELHRRFVRHVGGTEVDALPALMVSDGTGDDDTDRASEHANDLGDVVLEAACVVEALAVDARGAPVEGARMFVDGYDAMSIGGGAGDGLYSDAQGRWRVPHVPLGRRGVHVVARDHLEAERTVELARAEVLELETFVLLDAPSVFGRVVGSDGEPLEGASVSSRGYTLGWTFACDADGRFEARLPKLEGARLSARAPGHLQLDGVRVAPGERDVQIELEYLAEERTLEVVAAADGRPIERYGLRIHRFGDGWVPGDVAEIRRDPPRSHERPGGACTVHVRPLRDRIEIAAEGWRRVLVDAEPLGVEASERVQRIELEPVSGVHGRVVERDEGGGWVGVPGVRVEILESDASALRDVEASEHPTYAELYADALGPVLARQGYYFMPKMHVVDGPLPPVAPARYAERVVARVTSDANGDFFAPCDIVDVLVALANDPASGRVARSRLLTLDDADSGGDLGELRLVEAAKVRGVLRMSAGDRPDGHTVEGGFASRVETRTDAYGAFTLERLTPGPQLVGVELLNGSVVTAGSFCGLFHVDLAPGEVRDLVVDVPTLPSTAIEIVVSVNGEPLEGGWIDAEVVGGEAMDAIELDAAGCGVLAVPADRELRLTGYTNTATFFSDESVSFPRGRASHRIDFSTLTIEVELPAAVDRTGAGDPQLSCRSGDRPYRTSGVLVRQGAAGPVYRFVHVPLGAIEVRIAPRDGAGGWRVELDERLAEHEPSAGGTVALGP